MGQVDTLHNRCMSDVSYILYFARIENCCAILRNTWLKRWYRNMPIAISQLSKNCQLENAKRQIEIRHKYYKCHVCQRLILLLWIEKRRSNIFLNNKFISNFDEVFFSFTKFTEMSQSIFFTNKNLILHILAKFFNIYLKYFCKISSH